MLKTLCEQFRLLDKYAEKGYLTTAEVAEVLNITARQVSNLANKHIHKTERDRYEPFSVAQYVRKDAIKVSPDCCVWWITTGERMPKWYEIDEQKRAKVKPFAVWEKKSFLDSARVRTNKEPIYLMAFAELVEEITRDIVGCGFVRELYKKNGVVAQVGISFDITDNITEQLADPYYIFTKIVVTFGIERYTATIKRELNKA